MLWNPSLFWRLLSTASTMRFAMRQSMNSPRLRSGNFIGRPLRLTWRSSTPGDSIVPKILLTGRRSLGRRSPVSKAETLDAMRLYEQAIRSARDHGFVQNEAWPMRWPPGSTARAASRRSPTPICARPGTVISAGAPTARCGNSMRLIRIWPLRRGKVRRAIIGSPAPTSRCRERRQSLSGFVQRDRVAQVDRAADDNRARECRRGSRPFDTAVRG